MTIDEPGYFERLARVEAAHWWSRSMWRLALDWLGGAIRGRTGLAALDVGCGAGTSLIRLAGLREVGRVVGLEPDPGALRLARRHGRFPGHRRLGAGATLRGRIVRRGLLLRRLPASPRWRRPWWRRARSRGSSGRAGWRSSGPTQRDSGRAEPGGDRPYRLGELSDVLRKAGLSIGRASYANGLPALAQEVRGRLRGLAGSRGGNVAAAPVRRRASARRAGSASQPNDGRGLGVRAAGQRLARPEPAVRAQHDGPGESTGGWSDEDRDRWRVPGQSPWGFGRFARQMVEALADSGSDHEFVTFIDSPSARSVSLPEGVGRVVVQVSEAPSRAASATGRRRVGDMLAMARARGPGQPGPDLFPGQLQLLPGLERRPGRGDDARHAGPGPSRVGLPDLARQDGLAGQGASRGRSGPIGS